VPERRGPGEAPTHEVEPEVQAAAKVGAVADLRFDGIRHGTREGREEEARNERKGRVGREREGGGAGPPPPVEEEASAATSGYGRGASAAGRGAPESPSGGRPRGGAGTVIWTTNYCKRTPSRMFLFHIY
jgi:hypothetical protein